MVNQIFSAVVPLDKRFHSSDGIVIDNIDALKELLAYCGTSIELREKFAEHVNSNKNDFAVWVRDVFGLYDLAELMKKAKTPTELSNIIKLYELNYVLPSTSPVVSPVVLVAKNEVKNSDDSRNNASNDAASNVANNVTNNVDSIKCTPKNDVFDNVTSKETLKKEISDRFDRSDKVFDKVKLMKKNSLYDKKYFEVFAEKVKDRFAEIDTLIDNLRREGKDMSYPQMLLRNVRPKIAYFVVSQNPDDLKKINEELDEIVYEINYAKVVVNRDLRSEIINAVKEDSEKRVS